VTKHLKTTGTCACGEPVPLKRLKDKARATCPHCEEVLRLLFLASHHMRAGSKERHAAPHLQGEKAAAAYLRAAAEQLHAAAFALEAHALGLRGQPPAQQRQWLTWAKGRAEWGARMAANALPLVTRARNAAGLGLVAVPGDGLLLPGSAEARPLSSLTIVRGGP
jgi:hypothetical protein